MRIPCVCWIWKYVPIRRHGWDDSFSNLTEDSWKMATHSTNGILSLNEFSLINFWLNPDCSEVDNAPSQYGYPMFATLKAIICDWKNNWPEVRNTWWPHTTNQCQNDLLASALQRLHYIHSASGSTRCFEYWVGHEERLYRVLIIAK